MNKHKKQYDRYKQKIEDTLDDICCLPNIPTILEESIKYSVLGGGKRLRSVLVMAVNSMLGGTTNNNIARLACVIELIHCYSLIHDDLPCMDDDDIRRGKPTTHKVYGEAVAVLCGDALLNLAYEIGFSLGSVKAGFLKAMQCISANAGGVGMIGGQVEDILIDINNNIDKLEYIYISKTAALFCASLVAPARMLGVKENIIEQLDIFGRSFGIGFQIYDDLSEYYGGSDKKHKDKLDMVRAYGDKKARQLLSEHILKCKACLHELQQLNLDISFLEWILNNSLDL